MGLIFRKSIKVGPFRYNLSGSGIGVSVGFKGFRLGKGPRGNYVHMGRNGVYYRASLPGADRDAIGDRRSIGNHESQQNALEPEHLPPGFVSTESEWITTDSSPDAILTEIAEKQKRGRLAPWVFGATILLAIPALAFGCGIASAIFLFGLVAYFWARKRDAVAKAVVVGYHLEGDAEVKFESLCEAVKGIARARRIQTKIAVSDNSDLKRNAGATQLLVVNPASISIGDPPTIHTNISIPILRTGKDAFCFFPDRLIAFVPRGCFAVQYPDLKIEVGTSRLIEAGGVPSDAEVVDHTWKYVNKKGGPDKRFKDNRQLPILRVEEIRLTSPNGLNLCLQVSAVGHGNALVDAIGR